MYFHKASNYFKSLMPIEFINKWNEEKLQEYEAEGLISNIDDFKAKSRLFWTDEAKKTEPHSLVDKLLEGKRTIIDKYVGELRFSELSNAMKGKKLQVLKTVQKQLELYETAALSYRQNYHVFLTLPTKRKHEKHSFPMMNGMPPLEIINFTHKQLNELVALSQDTNANFFKGISGLREDITATLKALDEIIVPNVYENDMQTCCQSFGAHHVFRYYKDITTKYIQDFKNELMMLTDVTKALKKFKMNEEYKCVCGNIVKKSGKQNTRRQMCT